LPDRRSGVSTKRSAREGGIGCPGKIAQLVDLKSIGVTNARQLVKRGSFDNRRQVRRYFGLTGTPYDSGASRREQGISKLGNHRARKLASAGFGSGTNRAAISAAGSASGSATSKDASGTLPSLRWRAS
jgi:transposase